MMSMSTKKFPVFYNLLSVSTETHIISIESNEKYLDFAHAKRITNFFTHLCTVKTIVLTKNIISWAMITSLFDLLL